LDPLRRYRVMLLAPRVYFPCYNTEGRKGCKYFERGSRAYEWCEDVILQAKIGVVEKYSDPKWKGWNFVAEYCAKNHSGVAMFSWCCNKVPNLMNYNLAPCKKLPEFNNDFLGKWPGSS
jgi:hypothetical protein